VAALLERRLCVHLPTQALQQLHSDANAVDAAVDVLLAASSSPQRVAHLITAHTSLLNAPLVDWHQFLTSYGVRCALMGAACV
jgi:hypothetical protein